MIRAAIRRSPIVFVIAWLTLAGGCARLPDTGKTLLKPKTLIELQEYLLNHKADLDQFRLRGPFAVARQDNYEIRLSTTELVNTDLFLAAPPVISTMPGQVLVQIDSGIGSQGRLKLFSQGPISSERG